MTILDVSRHRELFNPHYFTTPITIIGAGSTGSWLALALAKLGIEDITVWDFDVVEEHNIANQAYSLKENNCSNIGEFKTTALQMLVKQATETLIHVLPHKFTNQRLAGIVFLMVDTMSSRKEIWENSIKYKTAVKLLVEPRMGLDVGRVYNVNPMNPTHIKKYENTYYDDDVAEVSACGASQSVISSAMGVTAWCTRQLINWHNNEEMDNEILIDFKYNNIFTTRW